MGNIIVRERDAFRDGPEKCRIQLGVIGPIEEVKSIFDLIAIQIPDGVLKRLRRMVDEKYGEGSDIIEREEFFDSMLAIIVTNPHSEAEYEIFRVLREIVDFKELTTQALYTFASEIKKEMEIFDPEYDEYCYEGEEEDRKYFASLLAEVEGVIKQRYISGYVYLIKSVTGHWKIGKTVNPKDRMKTFGLQLPIEVEYEHIIPCANHHNAEEELHTRFASKRLNGEWFCLDESEIAWIKAIKFM